MAKKKLHYSVSFEMGLTFDEDCAPMQPCEIKENIKFWLEGQFSDYFEKFKISKLKCKQS